MKAPVTLSLDRRGWRRMGSCGDWTGFAPAAGPAPLLSWAIDTLCAFLGGPWAVAALLSRLLFAWLASRLQIGSSE